MRCSRSSSAPRHSTGHVEAYTGHPKAYQAVTVGPGPAHVHVSAGAYRVAVDLAPNRASARDGVTITLRARAVRSVARTIALSYAMPSMGMPQVLASTLTASTRGAYHSLDPELAMPGTWQLPSW